MRYVLTGAQMKACDADTIHAKGMPSAVLMERAALATAEVIKEVLQTEPEDVGGSKHRLRAVEEEAHRERTGAASERVCLPSPARPAEVLVLCGSGNNGGDGFAIARLLLLDGIGTEVCFLGKEASLTGDAALQKTIYENYGGNYNSDPRLTDYKILVDALFGVGLSRPVEGVYAEMIGRMNRSGRFVVAVDLPSGVSADTGEILGTAVRADVTVTFGFEKRGLLLFPGAACCGKVLVKQVGIGLEEGIFSCPPGKEADALSLPAFTYGTEDLARLPRRVARSNKGSYGRVLLIAGGENMAGAAYLAAEAAYRTGCGLVRVLADESSRMALQTGLPEAIFTPWQQESALETALPWATVIGIGPGLGTSRQAKELLKKVLLLWNGPLVIDADGLNLLAEEPEYLASSGARIILTPHPGEMARLTKRTVDEILAELAQTAVRYAGTRRLTCVLKDARTVVSDGGRLYINTSGNNGMATGGSGDALTGVICGLLAQGMESFDAACLGVYAHGLAGELASRELGRRGMLAGDLVRMLPRVLRIPARISCL